MRLGDYVEMRLKLFYSQPSPGVPPPSALASGVSACPGFGRWHECVFFMSKRFSALIKLEGNRIVMSFDKGLAHLRIA